jgi:hypothetical protein
MGFDPALVLMEDRPNRQVALQVFERLFHGDKLDVLLPQQRGIVLGEVGAQQIAPFASTRLAQLLRRYYSCYHCLWMRSSRRTLA